MLMNNCCDLHTHSCYSDGTCTPAEIIDLAVGAGLSAVALTDHNTIAGLPSFLAAAEGKDILAIPGVEISTGWNEKELHIVGLFLPAAAYDAITEFLKIINIRKEDSNRKLICTLSSAGYDLDYEAIRRSHPEGTVNRAVIAAALLARGYVSSVKEAFQTLVSSENGYYTPPERISVLDAIGFLASIHAVPVLAHPFLSLSEAELREFLPEAKKYGLKAMETRYASYSSETERLAEKIAAEFSLLHSGGSDFHGTNKPDIRLGIGKGGLCIPTDYIKQLQEVMSQ